MASKSIHLDFLNQHPVPHDPNKLTIDSEQYKENPFIYIRETIKRFHEQKNKVYNETEDFDGIVIKKLLIDANEYLTYPILEKDKKKYLKELKGKNLETFAAANRKISFYKVIIPQLESYMPTDNSSLECLYSGITNTGFFVSDNDIKEFSRVRISHPIISQKLKQPLEIILNYGVAFSVAEKEITPKEASEQCKQQELSLTAPPIPATNSSQTPIVPINSIQYGSSIYSYRSFADDQESEENSPVFIIKVGGIQPQIFSNPSQNQENLNKQTPDANGDKKATCPAPTVTSTATPTNKPEPQLEDAFLKNGKRVSETKIDLGGAIFYHPDSSNPKAIKFDASIDPNTVNPFINYEEDFRQINMVVVKEVPFINISDYVENIKSTKQGAAHFAIDYFGVIYQFTDTKNLVKCYNPTIDEKSIYISVLNIPFLNSKKTIGLLNGSKNLSTATSRTISDIELKASFALDKLRLNGFYTKNGIKKEELFKPPENLLQDRKLVPNYRYDNTKEQKYSLERLIKSICKSYGIEKKRPKMLAQNPEIMAGDYNGVIAPFYFSQNDSSFLTIVSKEMQFITTGSVT